MKKLLLKEGIKHNLTFTRDQVDFGVFFAENADSLVRRLGGLGTLKDREDAVTEAILKVAGLHPRFHLEEDPGELDAEGLYGLVYGQAKFILGHKREEAYQDRFKNATSKKLAEIEADIQNDRLLSERTRELLLRALRNQAELRRRAASPARDRGIRIRRIDRRLVRAEILRIVHEVLERRHVKATNIEAYLAGYFSQLTTAERSAQFGLSADSLFVQKNRYEKVLAECRAEFAKSPILTDYFPFIKAA